ncbi:MAG TPA: heavy-metal-associated domain-containing protein [Zoogloea sp.]|uniref:heavy-metal-associated domain-containing protein n=1 Tax=Zoogloea sp. TaxID=49181 RepID=UPI002CF87615|nr:heavy-metal-associated domain-containing protein [Zoogloea sp.]HMV16517.1 heavy-metal-associated domain-containing protein [Rhodocyclaceae bacterium]HMV63598.1 heavy-metal-associated domain-containing protein [Rhodocyclaceae bacterium]HMW50629.1 heavy-metal-associated domain-containing protein [Rhodocyclaceae bacterium]HMY48798.1 heavy-metal-associated domain-containing protein [Rhodocyclaceae bacterium]HMZ75017.1 heavy-metal-associated domain-containing protein [Rhodocyclaceae bacterium]
MQEAIIQVGGMSCQGCVRNVTGALSAVAGVTAVEVSLERGEARVNFDPARTGVAALRAAVEEAGFDAA